MDDFPDEWCGLWIDEGGKGVFIEKKSRHTFLVTVICQLLEQIQSGSIRIDLTLEKLPTEWVYNAGRECFHLQVEAGIVHIGPTYNLYCTTRLADNKRRLSRATDDIMDVELLPEVGLGLYDDFEDDRGVPWGFPYLNYRKASKEAEERFRQLTRESLP